MDYENWKERMVKFPRLEEDRYGEDILETSRNVVWRLFRNADKGHEAVLLKDLYYREFWLPVAERVFGVFKEPDIYRLVGSYSDQRKGFYKAMEDPLVKEAYIKAGRETIFVWGKKE
jgi:hypothetical protein